MDLHPHRKRFALFSLPALAALALPLIAFAAVMQSTGYKIQTDSINIGGVLSTSTTYIEQDTVGEVATGRTASASYLLSAGYQAMQDVSISITSPVDVALSPINGLTGGTSSGSAVWTVTTDDPAGYAVSIKSSTNPALKSSTFGSSFSDYTPASDPDFAFTLPTTQSRFGFSPEGTDIVQKYKDNGSICNTGASDTTDACWDGLNTTGTTIAQSATSNHPSGTPTTVKFRAGSGTAKIQDTGSYSATVTVTATAL